MKKLIFIIVSSFIYAAGPGVAPTASFINGESVSEDKIFKETLTKTYTKKYCHGGYKELKKELKNRARVYCVNNGWSHKLYDKRFTKISCQKIKRKHHKTKVTVKATFSSMCIN